MATFGVKICNRQVVEVIFAESPGNKIGWWLLKGKGSRICGCKGLDAERPDLETYGS